MSVPGSYPAHMVAGVGFGEHRGTESWVRGGKQTIGGARRTKTPGEGNQPTENNPRLFLCEINSKT